jgi:hypothetical protein
MCPVHHLQEKLMKLSTTNIVSTNLNIPVVAMKAADDTASKQFTEFLEAIQKKGM